MYNTKQRFPSSERRSGNIGGFYIDGNSDSFYIAHSSVNNVLDAGFRNYKGTEEIILLKENRRFEYVDVVTKDGTIRTDTFYDSEAKIFEYLADRYDTVPFKEVTVFSQRGMCPSCKGVMEQFKAAYPEVKINVISNKKQYGAKW